MITALSTACRTGGDTGIGCGAGTGRVSADAFATEGIVGGGLDGAATGRAGGNMTVTERPIAGVGAGARATT